MPSVYPGALDALSIAHATAETIVPATDNDQSDAINKIEAELGVDPSASFTNVATRLNARVTCRKTTDLSLTTQVLANVPEMAFTLLANADYYFKFLALYAAGTARGYGHGVTFGGTLTYLGAESRIHGLTAGPATTAVGHSLLDSLTSSGDSSISAASGSASIFYPAIIEGIISVGATGGTLQYQARQGSGATAANATVKKGSWGEVYLN